MIKVAIIGCGHWGINHVRNFKRIKECQVLVVVDADKERLAHVKDLYGSLNVSTDAGVVFGDKDLDAVVIATPASTHYGLVKKALSAGKHVLCEKPLAVKASEAEELSRVSGDGKKILMTGNTFLFNPGILKLKEIIARDSSDRIYYATSSRTNMGPIRGDVNVLYDLAAHDIAIFNFLFGSAPVKVAATGCNYLRDGVEDVGFLTLIYPGAIMANILVSWLNPRKVRQITIVAEKKMITWDEFGEPGPVTVYNKGVYKDPDYKDYSEFMKLTMWEADVNFPRVERSEPLQAQNRHFIESIFNATPPESGPDFNIGVVKALEAAQRSLRDGGAPVSL